ncbi:GNAT family acetyltransferase [Oleiphilus messinensis]|uniref:GNAT family acetyltransferase n=1 Tax=Oleiphilus messinensis TaxID=141451 RepID=A0A1Y0I9U8_9GAMM|nr:acetyltransferase [Oleiphilus messinensis]ARU57010.1 GNAT family acetyltransferase [Oleiphilus messinensis]
MKVDVVEKSDYNKLIQIWEASVRATHDFLLESDLQALKPLILHQYFDAVALRCVKSNTGEILGFCGVHEGNIEMLFISPDVRGQGIGKILMEHAIKYQGATKVDVNEQNQMALGFYKHIGFSVKGRSPTDGQGKAYPLLHLEL